MTPVGVLTSYLSAVRGAAFIEKEVDDQTKEGGLLRVPSKGSQYVQSLVGTSSKFLSLRIRSVVKNRSKA